MIDAAGKLQAANHKLAVDTKKSKGADARGPRGGFAGGAAADKTLLACI